MTEKEQKPKAIVKVNYLILPVSSLSLQVINFTTIAILVDGKSVYKQRCPAVCSTFSSDLDKLYGSDIESVVESFLTNRVMEIVDKMELLAPIAFYKIDVSELNQFFDHGTAMEAIYPQSEQSE